MTSKDAKIALVGHFLYGQGRIMAMTEFQYADVFTVTKSFYTEEVEVKVEKGDLKRELEVVAWAMGYGELKAFPFNKRHKHKRYAEASGKRDMEKTPYGLAYPDFNDIPNRFYFAVPVELEDLAMRGVRSTPYGLILLQERSYGDRHWIDVQVKQRAMNLHGKKGSAESLLPHMRKVCTESHVLMQKVSDAERKREMDNDGKRSEK